MKEIREIKKEEKHKVMKKKILDSWKLNQNPT